MPDEGSTRRDFYRRLAVLADDVAPTEPAVAEDPSPLAAVVAYDDAFLPAMADLWVASWTRTLAAIDFEARRGWLVDHLVEALDAGAEIRLAVVESGEVAGFVLIDPATGYLDQIAVHPDHWGTGIAEALIDAARLLSPARIVLDVNADNPRAVAFYERLGFHRIGEGVNPRSGLATFKLEWTPPAA